MEAGIIGLPNVGKSTLFNALTAAGAVAANYPFATIEPNIGVVTVPDPRLADIAGFIKTEKIVPAALKLVDIAGLVAGASCGEGMGNRFLSHIREVDALCHVVRCFDKAPGGEDITHVSGRVDPISDIEVIDLELVLADLELVEQALQKAERAARSREAEAVLRCNILKALQPILADGLPARTAWTGGHFTKSEEQRILKSLGLVSAKRILYIANVDENDVRGAGELARQVRQRAAAQGMQVVPVCAKIEAELAELAPADRQEMLADYGLAEPALASVARAIYRLLGYQSFYTAGPKEVRAWPIPAGATAPEAAGVIHTDFQKGFIRCETYSIADLLARHSEKAIREAGKMRSEGKEYVMQDGDVCHFLFNV